MKTKTVTINQDIANLVGATSKDKDHMALSGVHFNGSKIFATNGYIAAIMPKPDGLPENTSIDLSGVKIPKNVSDVELSPITVEAGEYKSITGYKHYGGIAPVLDCTCPNIEQVIPAVTPETHMAITLNPELLVKLAVAMRGKVNPKKPMSKNPMITLLISRTDNLAVIGAVCGNDTIGVIMPVRTDMPKIHAPGEGTSAAMEKFNHLAGKKTIATPLEGAGGYSPALAMNG